MKLLPSVLFLLLAAPLLADQQQIFGQSIQPLLKEYCITCHSTEEQKGDLDLERFASLDPVKRDPSVWEHSLDQILDEEMPPKGKLRPSPESLQRLTDWMRGTLDDIALASAGDPGPVVLRRLSNHEYTYTLLDNTMILHCSSMMAGAKHDNDQLPVIVLGGRLPDGRVLDYSGKPERQLCRLFLSMMDKMDVHPKTFGDAKLMLEEV